MNGKSSKKSLSKSRFVLKQAQVSGSASSDLTRYIAKHDLDRRREGERARPLFTERADDLSFWEARKWLSITGGALSREDVLHYVLSFENLPDYNALGKNDRERATEIRAALRRALASAAKQIGVQDWRWTAGIHLNKRHPHVHILLNKNAVSSRTGDLTRVTKLLPPLVAGYPEGANKEREFDYGVIINSFAETIDARIRVLAQERVLTDEKRRETTRFKERSTLTSDRILLGESMLARHEMERLSVLAHFLEKRKQKSPEHVARLQTKLDVARQYHESLQPHVENLRARYKEQNAPLPLPMLSPADIRKLQDAAIERRDAGRIGVLEKVRLGLAAERQATPRNQHERGRLAAQRREAETDLQERAWRENEFERSCHLIRFKTDGTPLSLAGIDLRIERERVKVSFIHTGIAALFPSGRQAARVETVRLQTLRRQTEERIRARHKELNAEREQAAETIEILREISEGNALMHSESSREKQFESVTPIYTRAELARMETRAHRMHDAGLLLEVHAAKVESRARLAPEKRESLESLAARAFAQEIVAEIGIEEAREARTVQTKRSRFTPVAARLADGSLITGSVRQTEIFSRADAIIHTVENNPERRERYAAITRAAVTRDTHAKAEYDATARYFTTARSVADSYRHELARNGKPLPAPAFTQSEIDRIDRYLAHSTNAEEHRHLYKLLDRSEQAAPTHTTTREQKSQTIQPHVHTR